MTTPTLSSQVAKVPATKAGVQMLSKLSALLAAPLLLAVVVQNFGNLLTHAVLGRTLPLESYGAVGAVLAFMVFLTVPLTALQAAASKAGALSLGSASSANPGRRILFSAVAAGLFTSLITPALTQTLRIDAPALPLILGAFVTISILLAVTRGRLLGRHGQVGVRVMAMTLVISAIARLVGTVALTPALGIAAAIGATLAGEALALAWGYRKLYLFDGSPARVGSWLVGGGLWVSAVAIAGLFLLTTVDLFLARIFLDDASSGGYVAAATIGKTVLALPAAALAAAYPRLVKAGRLPGARKELLRTGAVVVGLGIFGALAVAVFANVIVGGMYGQSYAEYVPLVRGLALIAGLSVIASFATYALMATGSRLAFGAWVGAAVEVVGISFLHGDPGQIASVSAVVTLITGLFLTACVFYAYRTNFRKESPLSAQPSPDRSSLAV